MIKIQQIRQEGLYFKKIKAIYTVGKEQLDNFLKVVDAALQGGHRQGQLRAGHDKGTPSSREGQQTQAAWVWIQLHYVHAVCSWASHVTFLS